MGYLAAGMLVNSNFLISLWLAAAHMSFVIGGYAFLIRLSADDRRLRRPFSIVYLCIACVFGALAAGVMGSAPAILLSHGGIQTGIRFCFISELANSLILLPMILAAPSHPVTALKEVLRKTMAGPELNDVLPVLALILTIVASVLVNGPGAFAYPVPALLWCALRYDLFSVTVLTFLFSIWPMIFLAGGVYPSMPEPVDLRGITSLRLAIGLIALGPLVVASMSSTRNELIRKLKHAVSHDFLTDTLTRSALLSKGQILLKQDRENNQATAVIMLDIDRFKSVNDRYGHAAGDAVLVEFAARISKVLRKNDVFGRLGGEEFAIVLSQTGAVEGLLAAERIRKSIEARDMTLPDGNKIHVTVSAGLAVGHDQSDVLDVLLSRADRGLYEAKTCGRNQTCTSVDQQSVSPE